MELTELTNKYRIIQQIASGQNSRVYIGESPNNGIRVLKELDITKLSPSEDEMINSEINAMENLSFYPNCNQHLVCFYESFKLRKDNRLYLYIVLEYIDGDNLSQITSVFPPDEMINIMLNLALGVKYIHDHGYAHRDIKPENIILRKIDQRPIIIDFGYTCQKCESGPGTLLYAPPEVLNNSISGLDAAKAHDVWSLGITFYLLANRNFPFDIYQTGSYEDRGKIFTYTKNLPPKKIIGNIINCNLCPSNYSYGNQSIGLINEVIDSMLVCDWKNRPRIDEVVKKLEGY